MTGSGPPPNPHTPHPPPSPDTPSSPDTPIPPNNPPPPYAPTSPRTPSAWDAPYTQPNPHTAHTPHTPPVPSAPGSEAPDPRPVPLDRLRLPSDPSALYQELRAAHGPVAPVLLDGDIPAWLVLGYRELHQVTADPALFSRDAELWNQWPRIPDDWPLLPVMGRARPPVPHPAGEGRARRAAMIADALTAVDPVRLQGYAERFADALVDGFCARGAADVIREYATLLPVRVLAAVFGFPPEEGPGLAAAVNGDGGTDGGQGLARAVARLLERRRRTPGQDIASRLLASPEGLPDDEIARDLTSLLTAGHQPTADWIGNSLRLMLTEDRFAASLFGGRRSVVEAMNEVLWEDTPTQNVVGRWASRDTLLGGRRVRAGDLLVLSLAAANSDPGIRADRTVPTGGNAAFFSFGHGAHRCPFPAREIAEVIARTAIEVILDRLPDLDLAVPPQSLTRRPSPWLRGLSALPVRFTPTTVVGPEY
ncbi:cytochrome P450 [Streptomyces uncialis]|uniref:cytochrome P450 n=1 Tax=Streptomyces uncialis TaxID=1048205 RepID=UPI0037BC5C54